MKTLKSTLLLVLVTTFFISCGNEATTDQSNATDDATTETTTTTDEKTAAPAAVADASGKITDAVVQKACDCQENARQEDGTIAFAQVGECMGGKNKIQFVADLLGADATEKERADAEKALTEKMNAKCPQ
ncbi:hypothetical protein [Aureispira anguillae]|uniref:Secreted protein n=1 Tax=Aureispira anguillae TaxID=2864201 RepID=A0A915YLT9_9BACT|nr:hypothetical protein [Aureispira anguillae]BDS15301.1 hypothetical protein AsAng_0060850 [Aureispira anguillae]